MLEMKVLPTTDDARMSVCVLGRVEEEDCNPVGDRVVDRLREDSLSHETKNMLARFRRSRKARLREVQMLGIVLKLVGPQSVDSRPRRRPLVLEGRRASCEQPQPSWE